MKIHTYSLDAVPAYLFQLDLQSSVLSLEVHQPFGLRNGNGLIHIPAKIGTSPKPLREHMIIDNIGGR